MSENMSFIRELEEAFSGLDYPEDFLKAYDQMECLSSRNGCETFLVRSKETGLSAVAKCYRKSYYSLSISLEVLKSLEHPGITRYIESFENEAMLCLIREYIEGVTLSEYIRINELTQKEVLSLCLKLADTLIYLHSREHPIIHRDIKPDNIIVRPDGELALIDFDIARFVKPGNDSDTVFFGTRGYAPPEQYGFAQTDCRSDIYAFGVLLRYLLTNNERVVKNVYLQPELQQLIDKCTAFAPADRYPDMIVVKRALCRACKRKMPSRKQWRITVAVAAVLALCTGFLLGRFTNFLAPPPQYFHEPLIEAAVRAQLGVDASVRLNDEMLAGVREIYIHGSKVFSDPQQYYQTLIDGSVRGNITELGDVKLLPNLEKLNISYQGKLDISGVEHCQNLRSVELKHVRIAELSPLSTLSELEYLVLFDSGITAAALEDCAWLNSLDVGMTRISSMAELGTYPQLCSLSLKNLTLDSLDGIERMQKLQTVIINGADIRDKSALLNLPALERVVVSEDAYTELSALFEGRNVQILIE